MNEFLVQLLRSATWRFVGRCGATPEIRYFESGAAVANVNIAINQPDAKRDDGKPADWVRLEVWGADQAQAFADACTKGTMVDVSGRVRSNSYTDRNNETKHQWVMKVEQWSPVGQRQAPAAHAASAPAAAVAPAPARAAAPVWDSPVSDSDEVPF